MSVRPPRLSHIPNYTPFYEKKQAKCVHGGDCLFSKKSQPVNYVRHLSSRPKIDGSSLSWGAFFECHPSTKLITREPHVRRLLSFPSSTLLDCSIHKNVYATPNLHSSIISFHSLLNRIRKPDETWRRRSVFQHTTDIVMFLHRAVITKRRISVLHDGKSLFRAYTAYPTKRW